MIATLSTNLRMKNTLLTRVTSLPFPSILTLANKIIDQVDAPTPILAKVWITVVIICPKTKLP